MCAVGWLDGCNTRMILILVGRSVTAALSELKNIIEIYE